MARAATDEEAHMGEGLSFNDLNRQQQEAVRGAQDALGGRREPRMGLFERIFSGLRRRPWQLDATSGLWYLDTNEGRIIAPERDGQPLSDEELGRMARGTSDTRKFSAIMRLARDAGRRLNPYELEERR